MSRKFLVPIQLPANPTAALEAATKQYVDSTAWPVGSIYISVLATAPPLPGTWVAIDPGPAIAVNAPAAMTVYYWQRTA